MLPRVIVYNMVSVDGRMDWLAPDVGLYYEIAAHWHADAILSGSETILVGLGELEAQPEDSPPDTPDEVKGSAASGPLMVVVDSRGRLRRWDLLKNQPCWRDVMVLCSSSTPVEYLHHLQEHKVDYMVVGEEFVDMRRALEELNERFDVESVRVDSGGTLNGILLRAGLVDEISLLVHPSLVGGTTPRSVFVAPDLTSPDNVIDLRLTRLEELSGGVVWLRYEVVR